MFIIATLAPMRPAAWRAAMASPSATTGTLPSMATRPRVGPIVFDDFGEVKHYPKMFLVKGGQVLSYERWLDAERARIYREVQNLLINKG